MPGLLAASVIEAAACLKDGTLAGRVIERQHAGDDPNVLPFLKGVADGDDTRAFLILGRLLRVDPRLIEHPYVSGQFQHLFTVWDPSDPSLTDRAGEQLVSLVAAWAEGMTLGYKVTITKRGKERRGPPLSLFPHLDDRDGWLPTDQASQERRDADEFAKTYRELMERLKACVAWKRARLRYHGGKNPAWVYEVAERVGRAFEQYKREAGIEGQSLPLERLREIARLGLSQRRRGNPRHKIACELLATLRFDTPARVPLKLTGSLVHHTLESLKKRGIGSPRRRS